MSEDCISSTNKNLDNEKLYPVEKIVGRRVKKGKVEYLVRWKDYSPDTDSWEPSKDLYKTCYPLIKEFNADYKLLNNSSSIPTSTDSSNDTPVHSYEMIKFDKNMKPQSVKQADIFCSKDKPKENCKLSNLQTKLVESLDKHQFLCSKANFDCENVENNKSGAKINGKSTISGKNNHFENNNKISEPDENNHKKILYLEDNEIFEPYVPKSQNSSINGVLSRVMVKKPLVPSVIKPTDTGQNRKSDNVDKTLSISTNNLKRKSFSLVIGHNKKSKLANREIQVNPIKVIENDQIENLKKLISNNTFDCSNSLIKWRCTKPIPKSVTGVTEEKIEKCLKSLPFTRFKESDHFDSGDLTENRRTSIRQIEAANRFREIIVRKNVTAGFTEICLHNKSHSFPNCFNIKLLNELHIALKQAINDSSRVVLLSAIGSVFSSGIDLESIISFSTQKYVSNFKTTTTATAQLTTPQHPNQQIHDLVESMKRFVLELLHFPKPIVVGINGPAIGLGCAILPLCDLIYATELSSFYLPYTTLSQTPEAGSSLTLPILVGMPTANQLLLGGRKWSAKEALDRGLISEIIFSDKFKAELFSRCEKLAHVPSMSSETMKCMLRIHYKDQIDSAINMECRKLTEIWKSNEFRNCAQSFLTNELPNLLL